MWFILWLYIKYLICLISYNDFVKNAFDLLIEHNILFVKVFQVLSANKFMPSDFSDYFRKCTNNSSFSYDDIDFELLEEIKRVYNIQLYSERPINTGMIAIVFKGSMNGKDVAIKMTRRNIHARLDDGYKELQQFYKLLNFIWRDNPFLSLIANFIKAKECILDQCSFQNEIKATNVMRNSLSEIDLTDTDNLIVPEIYNNNDESRFIISEFLDGRDCFSIDDSDKDHYTRLIVTFAMLEIFLTNVVHTDSHPGNMIYMKRNGVLQIGIIDFGMHLYMSTEIRNCMVSILSDINNSRDPTKSYRFIEPLVLPKISFVSYTEEVKHKVNVLSERLVTLIKDGSVTEHDIVMSIKELGNIHSDFIKLCLNVEAVQLVIAQSCLLSMCKLLSSQEYIAKCFTDVIREIIS